MVTKWETWWGGIKQDVGMNIHTLLHVREITNKDLLCSTGNLISYDNLYEKTLKRMNICICITE